jgi:hypothetical protein
MRLLERLGPRAAVDATDAPELVLATATSTWRHSVLVRAYGDLGGDEALGAALPTGWRLARVDDRTHPVTDLIVVVGAGDGATVAQVRQEHPFDPLLAIVPAMADSSVVVAALESGADACVRIAGAPVVASHLLSMQRRREFERVHPYTRQDSGRTA